MKPRMAFWILFLTALAAPAADWPQLFGPNRNGTSSEKNLLESWPAQGPTVVWQRALGQGYAAPVVASGKLVIFHRVKDNDTVECLEATTGKFLWSVKQPTMYSDALGKGDGPRSTPVLSGDHVFTLGAGGRLACLELKSGKERWAKSLLDEYTVKPSYFGVGTTPIVEGKNLLINVGGDNGAGIIALNIETGKEVWRATDDDASYASPIAATVDGVRHVFFFTREGLVSVDPTSGKIRFKKRWRARIDASVNASSPVLVGGDHLFLTASYGVGAVLLKIKKDSVEEVWKSREALSCHFSTPVVVGDQLYGFEGRQEEGGQLRAIDWKTGKVRWTEEGYGCGSLLVVGNRLIVLGEDGNLGLVKADPSKYQVLAKAKMLGKPVRSHLALSNGLLYGRDNSKLVCWKLAK